MFKKTDLERRLQLVKKYSEDINPKNILDVGGTKETVLFFCDLFPNSKITCLNIKKVQLNKKNVNINKCSAEKMTSLKDDTFDFIHAGELLEHLFYPNQFIKEVKRVAKSDCYFILTTPNLAAWYNRLLLFFGFSVLSYTPYPKEHYGIPKILKRIIKPKWDHPRVFTYKALKTIFNENGFKLIKIKGFNNLSPNRKFNFIRFLTQTFPSSLKEDLIIKTKIIK